MKPINKEEFMLCICQKKILLLVTIFAVSFALLHGGTSISPAYAQDEKANILKAQADLKAIQAAILLFKKDTGLWPNRVNGAISSTNAVEVLLHHVDGISTPSPGDWPLNDDKATKYLEGYLNLAQDSGRKYPKWKGPYLQEAGADPWGNAYLVGVRNLERPRAATDTAVWIISAGPDGVIQTPISSVICFEGTSVDPASGVTAIGDDVCLKLK